MSNMDPKMEEERRQGEILSRHNLIDPAYTGKFEDLRTESLQQNSRTAQRSNGTDQEQESSLKLQGGDIHRDFYRIGARTNPIQRAKTFSHIESPTRKDSPVVAQKQPNGFRRDFLLQQQHEYNSLTAPITNNFFSFLELYESFAGEDLAESDDDVAVANDEEDEEEAQRIDEPVAHLGEQRPLLGRRKSARSTNKGDASIVRTFFLLIKSFIGTGVLFLPKAFRNGGLLFSLVTLVYVSMVSSLAFHLLLQCRSVHGGGYGDIGQAISGKKMRHIILGSITLSQLGFVCASIIFTAQNIGSFLEAVVKGSMPLATKALIALQLVVLIPLALIRNISRLGGAALLADVFILLGLGYIYYYDISALARHGISPTVKMWNPHDFTLTIGSCIFTFEGIGLILPVQSAMRQPQNFESLLYIVMGIITVIFGSIGALSYATFGEKTKVEVIGNFPHDNPMVNVVQFLYSLAVLVGAPVQLFPAVRIVEGLIFGHHSGKKDAATKWKKNSFRAAVLCACGIISALGASDLDKFVALVGSFACVPLVYIYPAYLHWKGVAENRYAKIGDILLMGGGFVAMFYTTCVTIVRWSE